ncbi:hypothetical protein PILCRDRAFT_16907 [Piloderma croceum F 1598]|uniref:Uncharacterized protein n=1 Tax=Piloderma croceum (strain F 1598) TaxID=765440 RepID=A0A0C3B300_PILCF|nr:hypothetical protein PILCRDRAFT_16907 [Piloderma croceum F 1598]
MTENGYYEIEKRSRKIEKRNCQIEKQICKGIAVDPPPNSKDMISRNLWISHPA